MSGSLGVDGGVWELIEVSGSLWRCLGVDGGVLELMEVSGS